MIDSETSFLSVVLKKPKKSAPSTCDLHKKLKLKRQQSRRKSVITTQTRALLTTMTRC